MAACHVDIVGTSYETIECQSWHTTIVGKTEQSKTKTETNGFLLGNPNFPILGGMPSRFVVFFLDCDSWQGRFVKHHYMRACASSGHAQHNSASGQWVACCAGLKTSYITAPQPGIRATANSQIKESKKSFHPSASRLAV